MKPNIRQRGGRWFCFSTRAAGSGMTMKEAFNNWLFVTSSMFG